MPKYDAENRAASLPFTPKWVHVFLVDARKGSLCRTVVLRAFMPLPASLNTDVRQTMAWKFPELKYEKMQGVACDIRKNSCNIIFPILTDEEVIDKRGHVLTFDEVVLLWKQAEPKLKEIERR